jgi:hypothetical protein
MKHESFVEGITKILQKRNVVNAQEAHALKNLFKGANKPNFDDFLLDEGLVEKDDLLNALAEYYQVPAFDVVGYFFNHATVRMFPKEFLMSNGIIPAEQDENILIVVASNPADPELLLRIGNYVSYDIQFRVGIRQDIDEAIEEFFERSLTEVDYNEDLDDDREMRITERKQEEEEEELAFDDFEPKE